MRVSCMYVKIDRGFSNNNIKLDPTLFLDNHRKLDREKKYGKTQRSL